LLSCLSSFGSFVWKPGVAGADLSKMCPQGYTVCHTRGGCTFGAYPEHYSRRIPLDGARGKGRDIWLGKMGAMRLLAPCRVVNTRQYSLSGNTKKSSHQPGNKKGRKCLPFSKSH
jgi:hypothetical protein